MVITVVWCLCICGFGFFSFKADNYVGTLTDAVLRAGHKPAGFKEKHILGSFML